MPAREETLSPWREQVERLASRDYRVAGAAYETLAQAGTTAMRAVLDGLSHPSPRVRRGCADFLDHQGGDACLKALREVALQDPVPRVRRAAVHSLGCQRCKAHPLSGDLVELLVQVAESDGSLRVRQEAVYALGLQPLDPRAVAVLRRILDEEAARDLRAGAHAALKRQDPDYRRAVDERAREEGIARARERQRETGV